MNRNHTTLQHRGPHHVVVEYDTDDPDHLPFVAVVAGDYGYPYAWYTAAELRELADLMDQWQATERREHDG